MRALVIPLGEDLYAIDMLAVREVVAAPRPTPLPTGPANALGVFNLRGEIVPLFDTALLLGLHAVSRIAFAVVIESALGLAGLVATDTPESVELGEVLATADATAGRALYAVADRVAALLDVETLLAPARIGAG
jgi:purine-binding chemotaxis protein CheW